MPEESKSRQSAQMHAIWLFVLAKRCTSFLISCLIMIVQRVDLGMGKPIGGYIRHGKTVHTVSLDLHCSLPISRKIQIILRWNHFKISLGRAA